MSGSKWGGVNVDGLCFEKSGGGEAKGERYNITPSVKLLEPVLASMPTIARVQNLPQKEGFLPGRER